MDRRQFLARSAACLGAGTMLTGLERLAGAQPAPGRPMPRTPKPNIVLIVGDDLGYGELGIQGNPQIPTPNIDSIAKNGVRFTDGYVSCPVCSPTRAGLMTGRYQQRFGHELNPGPAQAASPEFGLDLAEVTLPQRLKKLGYATGMFGKWHLGYQPQYHPLKRGFDEFFGFLGGAHAYLDAKEDSANPILDGEKPVETIEYTTDTFASKAADFIERHKERAFFVYLPFNAVHAPLQSLPKYLERFKNIEDPKRRTFAAMLSAMDDGVGKVLAKLREHKLDGNTIVIFISDNGGPTPSTTSGNGPLHGFKGQVYEGGIRVPFMMQWPGRIKPGTVYRQPVIALDIHPTVLAAAGGKLEPGAKPLDGVNLIPALTGDQRGAPHKDLMWRYGPQWAIRAGDWKLLQSKAGQPELYNLAQDLGETKDLATEQPEKVKELRAAYEAWNAQMIPPKWAGRAAALKGMKKAGGQGKAGKKAGKKVGNGKKAGRRKQGAPVAQ